MPPWSGYPRFAGAFSLYKALQPGIQATATAATVGSSELPPSRRPRRILHRLESVPLP